MGKVAQNATLNLDFSWVWLGLGLGEFVGFIVIDIYNAFQPSINLVDRKHPTMVGSSSSAFGFSYHRLRGDTPTPREAVSLIVGCALLLRGARRMSRRMARRQRTPLSLICLNVN